MRLNSVFPVLITDRLEESRDFYVDLLGLELAFDADWFAQLLAPDDHTVQLGLVANGHASIPERFRGATAAGLLVTVEVDDVDAVFERATASALPIELSLRDEEWGQRHFITRDPNGVAVDVVKVIAVTSPAVAAQYSPDVLPPGSAAVES